MTRDEIEAARKHLSACVTLIDGGYKLGHDNVARLIADGAAMARRLGEVTAPVDVDPRVLGAKAWEQYSPGDGRPPFDSLTDHEQARWIRIGCATHALGFALGYTVRDNGVTQRLARRDAEIGRLLATLDAWRTVTGADTPEALAAELDAYRARARPVRATTHDLGGTTDHPRTTR